VCYGWWYRPAVQAGVTLLGLQPAARPALPMFLAYLATLMYTYQISSGAAAAGGAPGAGGAAGRAAGVATWGSLRLRQRWVGRGSAGDAAIGARGDGGAGGAYSSIGGLQHQERRARSWAAWAGELWHELVLTAAGVSASVAAGWRSLSNVWRCVVKVHASVRTRALCLADGWMCCSHECLHGMGGAHKRNDQ
jgi:hypothetical protein